ncbi:hypothetical protein ACER0C_002160 [Sarotherodon galilaeus]
MVEAFMARWTALFDFHEINAEFKRIATIPPQTKFPAQLDLHLDNLVNLLKSLLWSLTAVGRKDLRNLSVPHRGCRSLPLKELLSAVTVSCMGWEMLSNRDDSLATILLSLTTYTGSRGHPRTELALRISLFSLILSPAEMLPPQQTTP